MDVHISIQHNLSGTRLSPYQSRQREAKEAPLALNAGVRVASGSGPAEPQDRFVPAEEGMLRQQGGKLPGPPGALTGQAGQGGANETIEGAGREEEDPEAERAGGNAFPDIHSVSEGPSDGARSSQGSAVSEGQKPEKGDGPTGKKPSEKPGEGGKTTDVRGEELSEQEKKQVQKLKDRDQEVRAHEQAHLAAGGQFVRGGIQLDYETGPDGRRYAVGGEVSVDTAEVPNDPEATLRKAQVIRRAALAPAEPSAQDRRAAATATQMEAEARQEHAKEESDKAGLGKADPAPLKDPNEKGRIKATGGGDEAASMKARPEDGTSGLAGRTGDGGGALHPASPASSRMVEGLGGSGAGARGGEVEPAGTGHEEGKENGAPDVSGPQTGPIRARFDFSGSSRPGKILDVYR